MSSLAYINSLTRAEPLRAPVIRQAIDALALPPGSRGLDAGCGIGLQAIQLARAVGPAGRVTGLDLLPELLDYARSRAAALGLAAQLDFRQGDLLALPFDDASFDWLWSADCAGYPARDPLALLAELRRVVRPGGLIALLFWSSQTLLPGYPRLEALLNATPAGLAPFEPAMPPELHPLRLLGWFRQAGLQDLRAREFTGSVAAPLAPGVRLALQDLLEMRWGSEPALPAPALEEYRRLCSPASPGFLLDDPSYHAFFTYTLFQGRVPA